MENSKQVQQDNGNLSIYERVRSVPMEAKKDGELEPEATVRNFRIVQLEGTRNVSRGVKHYNLQIIIAVGFKVNNERTIPFKDG